MAEALHQRGAGAERGESDQDRQGFGRRSPHHLPPLGADGSGETRRDLAPRRANSRGGGLTGLSHIYTSDRATWQAILSKIRNFMRGAKLALRIVGTVCPLA